jgi:CBS-domain-containing membrane protein
MSQAEQKPFEDLRVADVMVPLNQYPHIPYWFTLRQAAVEFQKFQLEVEGRKSLPRFILVFDEAYQLLGTVRRRDILKGLEPPFLVSSTRKYRMKLFDIEVDPNLSELSYDKMVKSIRGQAERPVSDVMQPIAATINASDHLMKAVSEFVQYDLALLPVLENGKVVGVVRTVGVFDQLAKIVL